MTADPGQKTPKKGFDMEKQKITVHLAGKEYTLVSEDSREYMSRIAAIADRKLHELAMVTNKPMGEVAILTCLNLADEVARTRDEVSLLRRQLQAANEKMRQMEEMRQDTEQPDVSEPDRGDGL